MLLNSENTSSKNPSISLYNIRLDNYYNILSDVSSVFDIRRAIAETKRVLENISRSSIRKLSGNSVIPVDVLNDLMNIYELALLEKISSIQAHLPKAIEDVQDIGSSIKYMQNYVNGFDENQLDFSYPYDISYFSDFQLILRNLLEDNTYSVVHLPLSSGIKFVERAQIGESIEKASVNLEVLSILDREKQPYKLYAFEGLNGETLEFLKGYLAIVAGYSTTISYSTKDITKDIRQKVKTYLEDQEIGDIFITNILNILTQFYADVLIGIPDNLSISEINRHVFEKIIKFNTVLFAEIISNKSHVNTLSVNQNGSTLLQQKFPILRNQQSGEIVRPNFKRSTKNPY